ncbi:MAG: MOSC domain-containing protein [Candidatus Methylomirabilales bacterium]
MGAGRLEAIWVKRMRRGPMDGVESATLVAGKGIVGNAHQGGRRQVTIIEQEAWEAMMRELGAWLPPSARRANLMLRGVRLQDSGGRTLRVGGCRIRIFGETKPCAQMDEVLPGLREVMYSDWRGGAFGEVLAGGRIAVGDTAGWLEDE